MAGRRDLSYRSAPTDWRRCLTATLPWMVPISPFGSIQRRDTQARLCDLVRDRRRHRQHGDRVSEPAAATRMPGSRFRRSAIAASALTLPMISAELQLDNRADFSIATGDQAAFNAIDTGERFILAIARPPTATQDHAVDAGDVAWAFDLPQPTVTHTPFAPVTTDHAVNAGALAWAFALPEPTVTHTLGYPVRRH